MRTTRGFGTIEQHRRRRGSSLGQVLICCAVVGGLALLLFLALHICIYNGHHERPVSCMVNLRMIGQAMASYCTDFDSWMICGGNRAGEHDEPPAALPGSTEPDFPFWYEALAPYVNSAVTHAEARKRYAEREGREPTRDQVADEVARMCMLYSCRSSRGPTAISYGYNYAAPHGVDAIYREKPELTKLWEPPGPVPVLWYGQSVHSSMLNDPSNQIAICDAGLVTNDADLKTPSDKWQESDAANVTGYVRFPLCDAYKQSAKYRSERAWRPVGRHNKRAVVLWFDCRARAIGIRDIADHPWGDRRCLFDNVADPRSPK
ncbi:MAG: hypothetical protein FJ291_22340 [Planctomycetes bacterium]|nr:hypothetical protein [Planctomycetota bacterium]